MKYLLVFLAAIVFKNTTFAQQETGVTKIFIVRHAEKETGNNPVLTAAGNARAGDLMQRLKDEGIQKIYVSQYKRTQNTGDSLRLQLNIDTVQYAADTLCDKLITARKTNKYFIQTVLIIQFKLIN